MARPGLSVGLRKVEWCARTDDMARYDVTDTVLCELSTAFRRCRIDLPGMRLCMPGLISAPLTCLWCCMEWIWTRQCPRPGMCIVTGALPGTKAGPRPTALGPELNGPAAEC